MTDTKAGRIRLMRQKIEKDPQTAFRVLEAIWNRQRPEEQFTGQHMGHDSRGFTETDTREANRLYERYESFGRKWQKMTALEVIRVQRMMPKYAKQYLEAGAQARDQEVANFKVKRGDYGKRFKATSEDERERIVQNLARWADKHNA